MGALTRPGLARRRRGAAVVGAIAVGLAAQAAYATSLSITSAGAFFAGVAPVLAGCDDSTTVAPVVSDVPGEGTEAFTMTGAEVSDIDFAACDGGTVTVSALGAENEVLRTAATNVTGSTVAVTFSPAISPASSVTTFAVYISRS